MQSSSSETGAQHSSVDEKMPLSGKSPNFVPISTSLMPPNSVVLPPSCLSSSADQLTSAMTFSFSQMGSGGKFTPLNPNSDGPGSIMDDLNIGTTNGTTADTAQTIDDPDDGCRPSGDNEEGKEEEEGEESEDSDKDAQQQQQQQQKKKNTKNNTKNIKRNKNNNNNSNNNNGITETVPMPTAAEAVMMKNGGKKRSACLCFASKSSRTAFSLSSSSIDQQRPISSANSEKDVGMVINNNNSNNGKRHNTMATSSAFKTAAIGKATAAETLKRQMSCDGMTENGIRVPSREEAGNAVGEGTEKKCRNNNNNDNNNNGIGLSTTIYEIQLHRQQQFLLQQQRRIDQLLNELGRAQTALCHHQTLLEDTGQRMEQEGQNSDGNEYWLCQLENARREFYQQQCQLDKQMEVQRTLCKTDQQMREQLRAKQLQDHAVQDIVRLIRQEPKAAILIVQLLRKYQLEREMNNNPLEQQQNPHRHLQSTGPNSSSSSSSWDTLLPTTPALHSVQSINNNNNIEAPKSVPSNDRTTTPTTASLKGGMPKSEKAKKASSSKKASLIGKRRNLMPNNSCTEEKRHSPTKEGKSKNAKSGRSSSVLEGMLGARENALHQQQMTKRRPKSSMDTSGEMMVGGGGIAAVDMEEIFRSVLHDGGGGGGGEARQHHHHHPNAISDEQHGHTTTAKTTTTAGDHLTKAQSGISDECPMLLMEMTAGGHSTMNGGCCGGDLLLLSSLTNPNSSQQQQQMPFDAMPSGNSNNYNFFTQWHHREPASALFAESPQHGGSTPSFCNNNNKNNNGTATGIPSANGTTATNASPPAAEPMALCHSQEMDDLMEVLRHDQEKSHLLDPMPEGPPSCGVAIGAAAGTAVVGSEFNTDQLASLLANEVELHRQNANEAASSAGASKNNSVQVPMMTGLTAQQQHRHHQLPLMGDSDNMTTIMDNPTMAFVVPQQHHAGETVGFCNEQAGLYNTTTTTMAFPFGTEDETMASTDDFWMDTSFDPFQQSIYT